MPEEKAKSKKPGTVRRILKWIGLGLLVLLLIAALIFQAPWKAVTPLLILLLACTALPRPARKWFWFSAAAVVIALIIWVFLPEDDEDWRPYTFDEEIAAFQARYAIPDSENAAIIYNQLLENYDPYTFEPNFLDPNITYLTREEPWSSKDYPQIAQWLQQHESTISMLIEASKFERCRFPVVADVGALSVHMETIAPVRRWAFLLCRAANNDLGEDRFDKAIEKQVAVLQMAKHLYQQPTIIDILVGIAFEELAINQFKRFIVTSDATEGRLSAIEQALADIKHDWSHDFPGVLESEKLFAKSVLCAPMYEINSKSQVRFTRDPWAGMRERMGKSWHNDEIQDPNIKELSKSRLHPTYWQKKLFKAKVITYWFYIPSSPQALAKIIDKSYEKFAFSDPNLDLTKGSQEFCLPSLLKYGFNYHRMIEHATEIFAGPYHRMGGIYIRAIGRQRGSLLLIAIRRYKNKYGHWPGALDDIKSIAPAEIFVDPINNNSFVYKLTKENFTLYSKGKNNIDEDGIRSVTFDPNDLKWPKTEEDDRLIWPPRRRKPKEENAEDA